MDINDITAKAAAKIDAARDTKVNAVKQAAASSVEAQEAAQLLAAAAKIDAARDAKVNAVKQAAASSVEAQEAAQLLAAAAVLIL